MSKTRAWIFVTIAAVAGLVTGLLLPRVWPAANRATSGAARSAPRVPPTEIASQLDLKPLVEKAVFERIASAAPDGISSVDPTGGPSSKHYAGLYQLKDPTKTAAVTAALRQEVIAAVESKGGTIWSDGLTDRSIGDETGLTYFECGYRLGGRAGTIHSWCARQGEYVSVVLTFYEIEGAAAPSAARADKDRQ